MQTVRTNLAEKSYDIHIGSGLTGNLSQYLLSLGLAGKAVLVTNPTVKKLYGDKIREQLTSAGFSTALVNIPDGESYKSLEQAGKIYDQMADFQAERNTPVIALGGGVIGDLAGFAAATYMRGVPLIQVPTTVLAQVDSSVGGKVAVNHGKLKNTIGTFYQPRLVVADTDTLKTLPDEELRNGLAEVIKYGLIRDAELFELIENNLPLRDEMLEEIITRCVAIKSAIVEQDEEDRGMRNLLNFGHTVGHAIESVSAYRIKHGHGVAIGMTAAAVISQQAGYLSSGDVERIKNVLNKAGLPVKIPHLDIAKIIQAMQHDKKKTEGKIRFILLKSLGDAVIYDDVLPEMLADILKELNA
jgi:3-dehydroquinate synthase